MKCVCICEREGLRKRERERSATSTEAHMTQGCVDVCECMCVRMCVCACVRVCKRKRTCERDGKKEQETQQLCVMTSMCQQTFS